MKKFQSSWRKTGKTTTARREVFRGMASFGIRGNNWGPLEPSQHHGAEGFQEPSQHYGAEGYQGAPIRLALCKGAESV